MNLNNNEMNRRLEINISSDREESPSVEYRDELEHSDEEEDEDEREEEEGSESDG